MENLQLRLRRSDGLLPLHAINVTGLHSSQQMEGRSLAKLWFSFGFNILEKEGKLNGCLSSHWQGGFREPTQWVNWETHYFSTLEGHPFHGIQKGWNSAFDLFLLLSLWKTNKAFWGCETNSLALASTTRRRLAKSTLRWGFTDPHTYMQAWDGSSKRKRKNSESC